MAQDSDDVQRELAELRAIARRTGIDGNAPVEPLDPVPADLWDRIATEVNETGSAPPMPIKRHRLRWIAAGAAAAAIAAAVVAAVVVLPDRGQQPQVVAATSLERLGETGTGSAELIDEDGSLRLRVEAADLDAGDGFFEVWMIDTDVQRLISLGPLRADGIYDVPAGVDPSTFPIVDVSLEPIDGNPAHSGVSVLRGQLPV